VFSEREGVSEFLPRTAPLTTRERAFERFAKPGDFRLRIFVTADEADMRPYCLTLSWKAQFDKDVSVSLNTTWP
jgi:hypothetical protein